MRIALLASGFPDYSAELAAELARRHEVLLWADARAYARERGDSLAPPGTRLRVWRQHNLLRRWSGAASLAARLRLWRPDRVIAHEHAHPHLTLLLRTVARAAPVTLIVHDPEPHPGRDFAFARRRWRDIVAQRRLADRLVAHGEACAARLQRLAGRAVTAMPHGPILRPVRPPRPSPGERRLLLFGRLEAYKGLEVLLDALEHPGLADPFPRLEIRGDGPELQRLARRLDAAPRVEVHPGWASRAELLGALDRCDVVVAPYLQASGSGVAAAALANGRGLVASETGGFSEMVRPGVNGWLAPPGDAAALATALREALPRAAELGEAALALAAGPFSWRRAAAQLMGADA
jgi:glycosyltransferase involved in cell wall biosynthesis